MENVLFFIAGIALGYWLAMRRVAGTKTPRTGKVVGLLDDVAEIANDDVQRVLGVSDSTATRVLDALQQSGDIVQVGTTGRGVVYRKR